MGSRGEAGYGVKGGGKLWELNGRLSLKDKALDFLTLFSEPVHGAKMGACYNRLQGGSWNRRGGAMDLSNTLALHPALCPMPYALPCPPHTPTPFHP